MKVLRKVLKVLGKIYEKVKVLGEDLPVNPGGRVRSVDINENAYTQRMVTSATISAISNLLVKGPKSQLCPKICTLSPNLARC